MMNMKDCEWVLIKLKKLISRLGLSSKPVVEVSPLNIDVNRLDYSIAQLPDELRLVLVLHDVEGIGNADIAGYLNIDERAVRDAIHLARLELRQRLRNVANARL